MIMSNRKYTVEINEETYLKFAKVGRAMNLPVAGECFEYCVDMAIEATNKRLAKEANDRFENEGNECFIVATDFEESNLILGPPAGSTEDEVYSLSAARAIWDDGQERPVVISCWKPDEQQLKRIAQTGVFWITLWGNTISPINISTENPLHFDWVKKHEQS